MPWFLIAGGGWLLGWFMRGQYEERKGATCAPPEGVLLTQAANGDADAADYIAFVEQRAAAGDPEAQARLEALSAIAEARKKQPALVAP